MTKFILIVGLIVSCGSLAVARDRVSDRASDFTFDIGGSMRLIADIGTSRGGLTAFAGPGRRFASGTTSAPFAEEGLLFHLAGGGSL
jgi:hypothetical protein